MSQLSFVVSCQQVESCSCLFLSRYKLNRSQKLSDITARQLLFFLTTDLHQLSLVQTAVRVLLFYCLHLLPTLPHSNVVNYAVKHLLHSQSYLSRCLTKTHFKCCGLLLGSLTRHLPSNSHVCLIPDQYHHCLFVFKVLKEVDPPVNAGKGVSAGNVVDEDCAVRIADVVGDQALELLLARSVPQLQLVRGALVCDVLHKEVNANCLLDVNRNTTLLTSNCSCVNRSMMADLPTALHPRKTILYFTSHNLVVSSNIQFKRDYSLNLPETKQEAARRKEKIIKGRDQLEGSEVRLGCGRLVITTILAAGCSGGLMVALIADRSSEA